jgi:phosphosulfolactate synthase
MNITLKLPYRELKNRKTGLTVLIDNGLPTNFFIDVINSHSNYIDLVKFGWGTSIVTEDIDKKIDSLNNKKIDFFFGGTLFEKFLYQNKIDDFYNFSKNKGAKYVEISNGTLDISNSEKAKFIRDFSKDFTVFSEVGYKDTLKSQELHPKKWIEYIQEDLSSGARKVITEARESGKSGICRENGEVRFGLIEEILDSDIDIKNLIFEAPNKDLQIYFIDKIGYNVNLANISFNDVIALETLRLGLRSDTFYTFEGKKDERF